MADQIKPRYRLGTQHMLDLAKDDATKIPERTLFRLVDPWTNSEDEGRVVVRFQNDYWTPKKDSVPFAAADGTPFDNSDDGAGWGYAYFAAEDLQPLI